jgi:transcriptional regulator with XRE-family HTH domain
MKPNTRLLTTLREAGLRQKDLARMVGETETVISQIVLGRLNIDFAKKNKIAKALGAKVEELFSDAPTAATGATLSPACMECRADKSRYSA